MYYLSLTYLGTYLVALWLSGRHIGYMGVMVHMIPQKRHTELIARSRIQFLPRLWFLIKMTLDYSYSLFHTPVSDSGYCHVSGLALSKPVWVPLYRTGSSRFEHATS